MSTMMATEYLQAPPLEIVQGPTLRDHEAETAVVGCALMGYVAQFGPEVFGNHMLRDIWRRIKQLEQSGEPIDLITVSQDNPEWSATLTQCVNGVPSSLHFEAYVHRVRDLAGRRAFVRAAEVGVKEVYDKTNGLDEILGRHFSRLSEVSHGEIGGARAFNIDRVADAALEALASPQEVWGMRTGWGPWDLELGGVHTGEVVIVAGYPGAGKSMLLMQTAGQLAGLQFWPDQVLSDPQPGAVFQLEMGEKVTIERLACAIAKVSYRKVRTGGLDDYERDSFFSALERVGRAPILFSDSVEWTTDLLKVEVASLIRDHGVRWVLVDYAGKLKDEGQDEIRRERKISQGIADIAHMGVAVLVVEQLNKTGQVYGSVQKQYDADVIFKLSKAPGKDAPKDKRRLRLEKAREADISMRFDLRITGAEKRFEVWDDYEPVDVKKLVDEIPF